MCWPIELRPNELASPRTACLTKTFILNLDKLAAFIRGCLSTHNPKEGVLCLQEL